MKWVAFDTSGVVEFSGEQQFNPAAMQVPAALVGIPSTQLRLVAGVIKDGALLTSFFINHGGLKCTMNPGGFQQLNCSWYDQLIQSTDGSWHVLNSPTGQKAALQSYAGAVRFQQEISGIAVNGVNVSTSRDSQHQLTSAYVHAQADPNFTWNWKDADGVFRFLHAADIIAMITAVSAHIQTYFTIEKNVVAGINNGTITTQAQIDAAFGI